MSAQPTNTKFLTEVNQIREEKISNHYNAAYAELRDKIVAEPLRTNFQIYAGCVSEEIAKEIAHRFEVKGTTAKVASSGIFISTWYLDITIDLPTNLVHAVPVPVSEPSEPAITE